MNKIKDFVIKYPVVDLIIICTLILACAFLFSNRLIYIFADRGRELLFPEEILNGKIPYKDILMIYFPTSYYINALIYKLLGVSINSLNISQTILCILYMFLYYFMARIFLNRNISLLLSILIISCCIFSYNDLFAFISPYSYARAYGMMSFGLCIFLLIKLFKTDNLNYAYWAALVSGFCFICKFEFFIAYLILITALCLYKKLKINQYLKIFLLSCVFPIILIAVLFIQGVNIYDIENAIKFSYNFSKSPSMTLFLSKSGMYPTLLISKYKFITSFTPYLITTVLLCFTALKLSIKYKNQWIILLTTLYIWRFFFDVQRTTHYWLVLPVVILVIFCFKYKEIFEDKALLILIIGSLLGAQRCFFLHSISGYGSFSFPLLILSTCVIIKRFVPAIMLGVKTELLVKYTVTVLIGLYLLNLYAKNLKTYIPLNTNKGTIYLDLYTYVIFNKTLNYIEKKIDKNSSILVLPEGHIINYITDRKTNLQCHMMDRLYHDALGNEKARNLIAWANTDYIILIKKAKLHDFYQEYLYKPNSNPTIKYIYKNYEKMVVIENKIGKIIIFKHKI